MEKEQAFRDAALNYEMAWKYGNRTNPTIGKSNKITCPVLFVRSKGIKRIIFLICNVCFYFRIQACFQLLKGKEACRCHRCVSQGEIPVDVYS